MTDNISIRPAKESDIIEIQDIYSHYVLNSTCTMDEIPPTIEDMNMRYNKITGNGWPWIVAVSKSIIADVGEIDQVIGYAYYSQFKDRDGYRYTVESSIYLKNGVTRQGIGTLLYKKLIDIAKQSGFHRLVYYIERHIHINVDSVSIIETIAIHTDSLSFLL